MNTIIKQVLPMGILLAFVLMNCTTLQNEIFVSPLGNDQNNGSKAHPFATIEKAIQATIQFNKANQQQDITIWLEMGEYQISKPIVIDHESFSKSTNQVFLKTQNEQQVVISGGVQLQGWQKSNNGLWFTQLPSELKHVREVRELFVNDQRAPRARFPNEGYLHVKKVGNDNRTHFYFEEADFPIPDQIKNTELILLHDWSITRISVKHIDQEKNMLTSVDSIGAKVLDFFTLDHWEKQPRYFLENDLQFMDQNLEWYFDKTKRQIFLKLAENVQIENLDIIIPISNGLLNLQGKNKQPIKNFHVEGITFRHSAWEIPEYGYAGIQATHFDPRPNLGDGWSIVPAAVSLVFTENCSFEYCTFESLGGSGLWIGEGCSDIWVKSSEFNDISGNGIMVGEGQDREVKGDAWWKTVPEQVAINNTIASCKIHDCGIQYYGAVGIWCGLTEGTSIIKNEVYNLPYTGISVGWMWNPSPTPAKNNLLNGNHIHHIMQKLSDGGGIYMLGLQPGSELSNNLIHDVTLNAGRAESNGMFLDEGTTDLTVDNNIIFNIAKSPIRFHKATTNLISNNTLFCSGGIPAFAYNNTEEILIKKVDNQIYTAGDPNYEVTIAKVVKDWQVDHGQ